MENFDHKILAEKIESLIETLKVMGEADSTKLNYSAQLSLEVAKKYLNEVNNVAYKLEEIDKKNESSEKIKSRTNRSELTSRSEFYFASRMVSELNTHNWLDPVAAFISEMRLIVDANRYTTMVSSAIRVLNSERNGSFYEAAISDLEYLAAKTEKEIKENLITVLHKHEWIPLVKQIIAANAIDEKELISNAEGTVSKVYSPVIVGENNSIIFALDGNYHKLINEKLEQPKAEEIDGQFLNTEKALKNFKVLDEKFVMYHGKHILSIDTKEIKVNNQIVEKKDLKNYLIRSTFFGMNEMYMLDEVMFFVESIDIIKELDFVTSITSQIDPRVKVNIFKINENIYINRINPFMNVNEMKLTESAEEAQTLVNEYVKFDITNSMVDLLEEEAQKRVSLNKEKELIIEKIKFLEEKKKEIVNTLDIVGKNDELAKALELMESELKDREVELQNVYMRLGHSISEGKSLEDQGFVPGKMKVTDGKWKKGQEVWVFAEDFTTRGKKEKVAIKDSKDKKEGLVEKQNVSINL